MRRLSATRVREILRIDEERGKVQAELCRLFKSIDALEIPIEDVPASLELENKSLCEKQAELWRAVLALDGVELSSEEISKEQMRIEKGIEWLQRILSHARKGELVDDDHGNVLAILMNLDNLLRCSRTDLARRQREYQMAQAKARIKMAPENHTESNTRRTPNG